MGMEVAMDLLKHLQTAKALDPHMADQIVLYLSLTDKESEFTTSEITEHLLTNLWVLRHFIELEYSIKGHRGEPGHIKIKGKNIRGCY